MNTCPHCHIQVQPDALYCEACGKPLGQQLSAENADAQEEAPQTGSLKERLAVLSGPLRQLKAKWPKKSPQNDSDSQNASRESEYKTASCSETKRSGKLLNILISLIVGIGLIAFWVWLLMRKTGERLVRLFL